MSHLTVAFREQRTVAVTHDLHVDSLVIGVRIAVVGPQKRADPHFLLSLGKHRHALRRDFDDLRRFQFLTGDVFQLAERERLKGYAVSVLILSDQHRQSSKPVARGDQMSVLLQDQDAHGTFDFFLCEANSLREGFLLVDQRCRQLGRVDLASGMRFKMPPSGSQKLLDQCLRVIDAAYDRNRVGSQMRTNQNRLRIAVADTADTGGSAHFLGNPLKLGPERRIFDFVDLALKSNFRVYSGHTCPARAQMRMIVHAEKNV